MVKVNGQNFIVYDMDTLQTILDRIAVQNNTSTKYLYFEDGIPELDKFTTNDDIIVEDLLATIKDYGSKNKRFESLYNDIIDKINQQRLDLLDDVYVPFITYNTAISDAGPGALAFVLIYQNELDNNNWFDQKVFVKEIWENREQGQLSIDADIAKIKKESDEQQEMFQKIKQTKGIVYTRFETDKINFEMDILCDNTSIIEMFNYIKLYPKVPFASFNDFYKILKDYVPYREWSINDEVFANTDSILYNVIIIKVLQRKNLSGITMSDYSDTYITVPRDTNQDNFILTASINTAGKNVSLSTFINTVLDIFPQKYKLSEPRERGVNGIFYFPNFTLNKYVLADLILTNPLFSNLLAIDESSKATKSKNSVYIHFKNKKLGYITANLTDKISEKGDPTLKGKDIIDTFPIGSHYIRVRISRAENIDNVKQFQILLSKLMAIYMEQYSTIVSFYKRFIPNFGIPSKSEKKEPVSTVLTIKDLAPEVFVSGYPKLCNKQPSIVTDDQAIQKREQGIPVMKYPMSEEEGFLPRNYVCDHHPTHPFPGLRSNPLSNNDIVPYLPCCFEKDHSQIEGKPYGTYFYGEQSKQGIGVGQQDFITTNKFTDNNIYGTLPEDIQKTIKLFSSEDNYMFLRKGVYDTKNSFLQCVLEALEDEQIKEYKNKDNIEIYLNDLRQSIAKREKYISVCKQSMYDFSDQEIIDILKDPKQYFDPYYFTSLLENFLECNIYVFKRCKTTRSQLMIPRHLQGYYKTQKQNRCIFIYEHLGSDSNYADYPRCELIVKWRKNIAGDVLQYADYDSNLCKGVVGIYNQLVTSYSLTTQISETIFTLPDSLDLIEQGIDSYGKCRMLKVRYKKQIITILTDPMAPMLLSSVSEWLVTKNSSEVIIEFAAFLGMSITKQNINNDVAKSYGGKIGNLNVTIPIIDRSISNGIPTYEQNIDYPISNVSSILNYNFYKKVSRYIIAYVMWLYSKYLYKTKEDISINSMNSFQRSNIKIDENFVYGNINKTFSMNSGVMSGNKLIVKSEETLKRLLYVLRIQSRNRRKILTYHTRTVIEDYYQDITDFDQYQFQVILQGEDSVDKWIGEQRSKYLLYDFIQHTKLTPYFFRNKLIDDHIYLAQNVDTLEKAYNIAHTWNTDNYNPGESTELTKSRMTDYTLYLYVNNEKIDKKVYGNSVTAENYKIIGYKIESISAFTVLLKL